MMLFFFFFGIFLFLVVICSKWSMFQVIEMAGVCAASDIWSVGCTVIELLTCVPPYYDLQPMPALFRIVQVWKSVFFIIINILYLEKPQLPIMFLMVFYFILFFLIRNRTCINNRKQYKRGNLLCFIHCIECLNSVTHTPDIKK